MMSERGEHSYPPVGDPDRLDSIVRRGRSLRRRRQLGTIGAGAGGALAVMLVVVLAFGGGSDDAKQLVADDPSSTTTTTTTTTTAPAPSTAMTAEILPGPPVQVRVDDPAQPVGSGDDQEFVSQQCVLASAYDPAAPAGALPLAQGWICAPGQSADGRRDLVLRSTAGSGAGTDQGAGVEPDLGTGSGTDIGCPATALRDAGPARAVTGERPGVTTFTLSAPGLPSGEYRIEVEAVSGIGDGCAPEQTGFERENVERAVGTVTLP
jgi:hypothetical protein